MSKNYCTKIIKVSNMTCVNCENRIENMLKTIDGIKKTKANYADETVTINYDKTIIALNEIEKILDNLDYKVIKNINVKETETKKSKIFIDIVTITLFIFLLYRLIKMYGGFNLLNSFPEIKVGMSLGIVFIIGLLTSAHCIAMCGGINISQCTPKQHNKNSNDSWITSLKPSILYNTGRVISYTLIGGIVGSLGSVISLGNTGKGFIAIIAAIFMVIMGLNTLNIFPALRKFNPRMPKLFANKINNQKSSKQPLYVGLLNGLMPCGPLQAMQLYALSTGDPWRGALSMFVFSLGTVPLMFGLGALSSILSKKFMTKMATASGVLVIILGFLMFSNGVTLAGIQFSPQTQILNTLGITQPVEVNRSEINNGLQTIQTTLSSGDYTPIEVKVNIPVKWNIQATKDTLNGCNERISIPAYGIEKDLIPGDNIIEFTPKKADTIVYSCWMGMISSTITIVD